MPGLQMHSLPYTPNQVRNKSHMSMVHLKTRLHTVSAGVTGTRLFQGSKVCILRSRMMVVGQDSTAVGLGGCMAQLHILLPFITSHAIACSGLAKHTLRVLLGNESHRNT